MEFEIGMWRGVEDMIVRFFHVASLFEVIEGNGGGLFGVC